MLQGRRLLSSLPLYSRLKLALLSSGMTRGEYLHYIQCMIVVFTYYNVAT